ncbi:MAG: glycosyltransferase family 2 protein [bacterium]
MPRTEGEPERSGPEVSVVVPCFNEAPSLETLHEELCRALEGAGLTFEVVYVDDGSTDGTWEVLTSLHRRDSRIEVVRLRRNLGKASALASGFQHARAPVLCTVDGDLQDDPAELPPLVARVRSGEWDLVVGWKRPRRDPLTKVLPSRVFNWILRRLSPARLHDFNCGLKVLSAEVARASPLYGDLYRFLPAFAAAQGYSVTEAAVKHRPRLHGRSKYGASRFLRGFLDLFTVLFLTRFRFRPLHLFGGLGLLFALTGLGVLTFLTALWFQGEPIGHRPLLLFGVLLFLTGAQCIGIGLIAEMVSYSRHMRGDRLTPAMRVLSHRPEGEREE